MCFIALASPWPAVLGYDLLPRKGFVWEAVNGICYAMFSRFSQTANQAFQRTQVVPCIWCGMYLANPQKSILNF